MLISYKQFLGIALGSEVERKTQKVLGGTIPMRGCLLWDGQPSFACGSIQ